MRGLAIPIRTNRRGGAQTLQGSEYVAQTIRVGLTPNLSANPFQIGGGVDVGVSERVVFDVNAPGAAARIRREVTRFFTRVRESNLARLATEDGVAVRREGEELLVTVRYVELESDSERELESNLRSASNPRVNSSGR